MTAQTLFEVHFTTPRDWLAEATLDAGRDQIQDGIIRLSLRHAGAKEGQLHDGPVQHGDDRSSPYFKSEFVEASYISTRQQLVKLSCYCGLSYHGPPSHEDGKPVRLQVRQWEDLAAATRSRVDEIAHLVVESLQALREGSQAVELRDGALHVEDGAWIADPGSPIESLTPKVCATCEQPIYYANLAWRHEGNKRAEAAITSPCRECNGSGSPPGERKQLCRSCRGTGERKDLDHLADPDIRGRKV